MHSTTPAAGTSFHPGRAEIPPQTIELSRTNPPPPFASQQVDLQNKPAPKSQPCPGRATTHDADADAERDSVRRKSRGPAQHLQTAPTFAPSVFAPSSMQTAGFRGASAKLPQPPTRSLGREIDTHRQGRQENGHCKKIRTCGEAGWRRGELQARARAPGAATASFPTQRRDRHHARTASPMSLACILTERSCRERVIEGDNVLWE